jgi:serine/threonine protein kinase
VADLEAQLVTAVAAALPHLHRVSSAVSACSARLSAVDDLLASVAPQRDALDTAVTSNQSFLDHHSAVVAALAPLREELARAIADPAAVDAECATIAFRDVQHVAARLAVAADASSRLAESEVVVGRLTPSVPALQAEARALSAFQRRLAAARDLYRRGLAVLEGFERLLGGDTIPEDVENAIDRSTFDLKVLLDRTSNYGEDLGVEVAATRANIADLRAQLRTYLNHRDLLQQRAGELERDLPEMGLILRHAALSQPAATTGLDLDTLRCGCRVFEGVRSLAVYDARPMPNAPSSSATVQLGNDPKSGATVVLKQFVLRQHGVIDKSAQRKFAREAVMLARVRSPNVVRLISCFIASQPKGGLAGVLVLEHFPSSLANVAVPRGAARFSLAQARRVVGEVLRGLCALHANGIVSAAVKPENIVVSPDFARVSLIDLSIARDAQGLGATLATGTLGAFSMGFCAPEAMPAFDAEAEEESPLSPSCDVFSAGMLLTWMLCCDATHNARSKFLRHADRLHRSLEFIPSDAPFAPLYVSAGLPDEVLALLARMLSPNPAARPSARECLSAPFFAGDDGAPLPIASLDAVRAGISRALAEDPEGSVTVDLADATTVTDCLVAVTEALAGCRDLDAAATPLLFRLPADEAAALPPAPAITDLGAPAFEVEGEPCLFMSPALLHAILELPGGTTPGDVPLFTQQPNGAVRLVPHPRAGHILAASGPDSSLADADFIRAAIAGLGVLLTQCAIHASPLPPAVFPPALAASLAAPTAVPSADELYPALTRLLRRDVAPLSVVCDLYERIAGDTVGDLTGSSDARPLVEVVPHDAHPGTTAFAIAGAELRGGCTAFASAAREALLAATTSLRSDFSQLDARGLAAILCLPHTTNCHHLAQALAFPADDDQFQTEVTSAIAKLDPLRFDALAVALFGSAQSADFSRATVTVAVTESPHVTLLREDDGTAALALPAGNNVDLLRGLAAALDARPELFGRAAIHTTRADDNTVLRIECRA